MAAIRCPKCGSGHGWLEEIDQQIVQRCMCGLMRFVARKTENGYEVMHRTVRTEDVRLPVRTTKLYQTLLCVAESYPSAICTSDIAVHRGQNNKETASMMTLLMARGLVNRVERKRGISGGSLWAVSKETITLMKLQERKHGA
jgi:hypothetical protein